MNTVMAWGGNKKRRELAEDVVNFCIKELMPRMKTLDICIEIDKTTDVCGYCLAVDNREFVLEIKDVENDLEFVETICHEMVHVKQHARGELKDINLTQKLWKGDEYIAMYSTHDEYMALPWEAEAYNLEAKLLTKYFEL